MKKHITIEPIGLVEGSSLDTESVLKTLEVADMWNCHIPELLTPPDNRVKNGYIGMAEVILPVSMDNMKQELQERNWIFAPANLIFGMTEDGRRILPQLSEPFTVLNAPKRFAGRADFYPWMHTIQGVRAFGLTPLSDIFTEEGEVRRGIRFPVMKIGK